MSGQDIKAPGFAGGYLLKSAALEFGQYNITVNALIPGLVDTPLTRYEKRLRESMEETGQNRLRTLHRSRRGMFGRRPWR